jgi:hypothetical protein
MKPSRRRPTRLVPRVVYQTAFAGVIPLCVGCSSSSSTGNPDAGDESSIYNGAVGCAAFGCGVAAVGFDSGGGAQEAAAQEGGSEAGASQDGGDAAQDAHPILAVACSGFACGGTDAGSSG